MQSSQKSNERTKRAAVAENVGIAVENEFNKKELCPAYGKTCNKCRKPNHFAVKCRSRQTLKEVKTLDEQEEILQTRVPGTGIDDSQLVTLKLESGNCLRFQVDTGAQCNVVPLDLYKKATKDHNLRNVKSTSQKIIAYGGTQIPVYGIATIEVSRGSSKYKLACKLVDKTNTRPLLGRKACVGMKIVAYLDNDGLNKPVTGDATVFSVNEKGSPLDQDTILKKHPKSFGEGVGLVAGEYHIRLDKTMDPVQHPPREEFQLH